MSIGSLGGHLKGEIKAGGRVGAPSAYDGLREIVGKTDDGSVNGDVECVVNGASFGGIVGILVVGVDGIDGGRTIGCTDGTRFDVPEGEEVGA